MIFQPGPVLPKQVTGELMKQIWSQESQWLHVQCLGGIFDAELRACRDSGSRSYLYVMQAIYADCSRPVSYAIP